MKVRKGIAVLFIIISLVLGLIFHSKIELPVVISAYFRIGTYNQFGPLAISIELLAAGINLFIGHKKANFVLALFGFTALLDPIFNFVGIFSSTMPLYGTIIFAVCALVALWVALSNAFETGRISKINLFGSLILGIAIELFFNYL